jgi:predicted glycosyltransferase involved in capsule biosynthesis
MLSSPFLIGKVLCIVAGDQTSAEIFHSRIKLATLFVCFHSVMYYNYAGGVVATKKETFMKINGYANSYWGWGNEDDDFSARYVTVKTNK